MTGRELSEALHALWPHVDRAKTVDAVIAGDADQEINGVAVCWMPYSQALREAASRGVNTVVTHEPTFYDHHELTNASAHSRYLAAKEEKLALIADLGLTILRCHDVWDAIPGVGVPFEWGKFLGLEHLVASERYLNLYRVELQTALAFAQYLAKKTESAGQKTVEFYGDPDRIIETVGVGTGCCSEAMSLYDFGADLAVTVDDIARAWVIGEYCHDTGSPLIVVNHGVSEDCAMESLCEHVKQLVPDVPVLRIKQGASYREVTA
ncbi:MAG: Nif3-like dinuclear metal center hexameric protein [Armatimonadetes bacterium]|nr:Nif3-like dinuclear metal center hexameric protein [Armatimonadota bacterium]